MEQLFKNDPLGESNAKCDLEEMFDSADQNGCFDVSGFSYNTLLSLEYAVGKGYCLVLEPCYEYQVTEKGTAFLVEYKKEMQELEKLALHAVD